MRECIGCTVIKRQMTLTLSVVKAKRLSNYGLACSSKQEDFATWTPEAKTTLEEVLKKVMPTRGAL